MNELSLHILDLAQNCIRAEATLMKISIIEEEDNLNLIIEDNGFGMDEATLKNVLSPFYTSRTTRRIGLGIPLFKDLCELTGGSFSIKSKKNVGTIIDCNVNMASIDSLPLGNIIETIYILSINETDCDLEFIHQKNGKSYIYNTKEIKEVLNGIPLTEYSVKCWIEEYLLQNEELINS